MTKAEWAKGRAAELRATAERQRRQGFGGSYSSAARRGQAVRSLEAQAWRLDRIAAAAREPESLDWPPF